VAEIWQNERWKIKLETEMVIATPIATEISNMVSNRDSNKCVNRYINRDRRKIEIKIARDTARQINADLLSWKCRKCRKCCGLQMLLAVYGFC
jgi:hypothetical protein